MKHLSLFIALVAVFTFSAAVSATPEIGQLTPDFTLEDAQGNSHTLSAYRGKVVVLEWTNPDCPYVQRHYQEETMVSLATAYQDTSVVWLAINTTHYNTAEATRKWSEDKGLFYPTLLDPEGRVGNLYNARTTPHMFVIDPSGQLVYDGSIDDDQGGKKQERVPYVDLAIQAALQSDLPEHSQTKPYGCSVKYASK